MGKDISLGDGITFTDNSDEVLAALKDQMSVALEAIGQKAEGYAKGLCPVDTGRLRNSISHTISGAGEISRVYSDNGKASAKHSFGQTIGSAEGTEKTAFIGTNVEYAPYQELGVPSRNIKAHHFLKKAASDHGSEYAAIARQYLKD